MPNDCPWSPDEFPTVAESLQADAVIELKIQDHYKSLLDLCRIAAACTQYIGDGSEEHRERANQRDDEEYVGVLRKTRELLAHANNKFFDGCQIGLDLSVVEGFFLDSVRALLQHSVFRGLAWRIAEAGFESHSCPMRKADVESMHGLRKQLELLCAFCLEKSQVQHEAIQAELEANHEVAPKEAILLSLSQAWSQSFTPSTRLPDWLDVQALREINEASFDAVMKLRPVKTVAVPPEPVADVAGRNPLEFFSKLDVPERERRLAVFKELSQVTGLLFGFRDSNSHLTHLSNRMAIEVLGWHVQPGDERKLWRNPDGSPVVLDQAGSWVNSVCQHPWRDGINRDDELSYSPGLNYHRRLLDWNAWTQEAIANPESKPELRAAEPGQYYG